MSAPPLLRRIDSAPPVDAADIARDELRTSVGARDVTLLLADYSGRSVVRFDKARWASAAGLRGADSADVIPIAGSVYEDVLRNQRIDVSAVADGVRVTVPVTVRGDAIGAVEVTLPAEPDDHALEAVGAVAHALGYVIVANSRYTDLFEWGQRTVPFTLAAEIQRRLLPSAFSCTAAEFDLAGWLEPAATVGGDTFDYALDRDVLHLSITDAVGNDVNAAMLATVFVSGLRNGRRRGLDLDAQTRAASDALAAYSPVGEFVTGQVVRLELATGSATLVNAGHPFPLLLRGGKVAELELDIDVPFGLYDGLAFRTQAVQLEPGDRVLFLTDGVLDRNSANVDAVALLAGTADHHPREVALVLSEAVVHATGGVLRDDSTVLCLDWHGPTPDGSHAVTREGPPASPA